MNLNPTLRLGDLLTRPKCFGFVDHHGVAIGPNEVLHNTPERGEHVASFDEFANGQPVTVRRTASASPGMWQRALNVLRNPRDYHPTKRNCEHTASEVLKGKPQSRQLMLCCIAAFCIIFCFLFLRRR